MEKIFRLLLGLFLPQLISNQGYTADCATLRAYGNPEYPPYLWRSSRDPNALVGANADYLDQIANDTKIRVRMQYGGTWARVQEEARYGRVDLVAGAFLTEERKKYLHYIEPALANTRTLLWVRDKEPLSYAKWSDLKRLRGITVINNSFGQKFDIYAKKNLNIEAVASLRQAFEMLRNGRVRYLIYEEWPAQAYVQRHKIKNVKALEPAVVEEPLFLAMAKKSPCATAATLLRITNAHQSAMKKNPMPLLLKENSQRWDDNIN